MRRLDPKLKTALTIIVAFVLMHVAARYQFSLPPEVRDSFVTLAVEGIAALVVGVLWHRRRARRSKPPASSPSTGIQFRPRIHFRRKAKR